ncbi:MAG TPA: sulfite oxidase-like oxidoreductase [Candidatus Saccharimonadales bacterium]|nr:sulfite oxidase-like oxidoreductase [Candidatus Saccharimonadales bacterium]
MSEYNQSYIRVKLNNAAKKFGLTGNKNSNEATDRLPPGQYLTQQFPILDLGERPPLELKDFTLNLFGDIENPITLTSEQFLALPSKEIVKDFHCVTRWSKYDLKWKGVGFEEIVKLAKPKPEVKHVMFFSRDLYTTNVSLEDCLKGDVIVAYQLDGQGIPLLHGGPVRIIVPHLYGWKSAKFLNRIRFSVRDEEGFWESRGYNNHADPWKEERYS